MSHSQWPTNRKGEVSPLIHQIGCCMCASNAEQCLPIIERLLAMTPTVSGQVAS